MDSILAILGSERFAVLISVLAVASIIAFVPELEPLRENVAEIIFVLTGLVIAAYTVRRPGVDAG